ncbi:MAG: twin-arginine translocase subunit TatB [Gammaproteobacteria bacterium]|nr:twin-arginine translocase subunit TatB [Gammaproteobacteria bacterium]
MFDIGSWELLVIAVVLLLVVGPDKLPGIARTAGHWFGQVRGFVSKMKADIEGEMHLHEVQEAMKQNERTGLYEVLDEAKSSLTIPADDSAPLAEKPPKQDKKEDTD